jgi:hypothetical protein
VARDVRTDAAELHARGVRLHNQGLPARALRILHQAAAALDAWPDVPGRAGLAARIWISIALDEWEVHSAAAGHAALDRAAQLASVADDPAVTVLLHCQRGLIELRGGDLAAAQVALDAAARLIRHAGLREQASIRLNRGTIGLLDGRLREARLDLDEAVAIARAAGLAVEEFKALHNLAYLEFLAGELPRALRLMDEAGRIDADVSRGVWLLDRARVLVEAGLPREADETLAAAAEIFRSARLAQDLGETELERARCALAVGDVGAARRFARGARDRFRRRGNDRARRSAELVLVQADLAAGRPGGRLVATAARLRAELAALGLRLPARDAALLEAEAHLQAGQVARAARAVHDLGPPGPSDPITGRMHSHYVHARIDAAQGRRAAASRRIGRALDELARYQASFGSMDLRTASAVHGHRLAELDIALAVESGRPAAIFAAAERARAGSSRLPPVRPPDDPEAAALLAELRQIVEALRPAEQDPAASAALLRRRRDLEQRIVGRSWGQDGAGLGRQPVELAAVRAALADRGATMVMYLPVGDELAAIVLGERLRLHRLGSAIAVAESIRRARADLDALADPRLRTELRTAVRASLRRELTELRRMLVAPLPVDGPLVVVSTGTLGQLPWAALPGSAGRSITVAPSASRWFASTTRPAAPSGSVVAVAGPDLSRAAAEARAVAALWPAGSAVTGSAATAAAIRSEMGKAALLHIAAHGAHQPQNPLFSSVRAVDGPVFAHELQGPSPVPDHVVLSSCEVGLAAIRPGDEALGLASVLLQLGTHSVVAGVARVRDDVAEAAMTGYHRRLRGGVDSAAALAGALADAAEGTREDDEGLPPPFVHFGAAWTAPPGPGEHLAGLGPVA